MAFTSLLNFDEHAVALENLFKIKAVPIPY